MISKKQMGQRTLHSLEPYLVSSQSPEAGSVTYFVPIPYSGTHRLLGVVRRAAGAFLGGPSNYDIDGRIWNFPGDKCGPDAARIGGERGWGCAA